jgi:hypothetical protein
MNVGFRINLAVACVSPPIGTSQAGGYRTFLGPVAPIHRTLHITPGPTQTHFKSIHRG